MSSGIYVGEGIYLANNFASSAFYSTGCRNHWKNGMYKEGIHVVGICEVISSPTIQEESGDTIVIPQEYEGNVALRYLLVYENFHRSSHVEIPDIRIPDGNILSYGHQNVDLSEHYERIRQRYASSSCSH